MYVILVSISSQSVASAESSITLKTDPHYISLQLSVFMLAFMSASPNNENESKSFFLQSLLCFRLMQFPLILHPAAFHRSLTSSLTTHETCGYTHTLCKTALCHSEITRKNYYKTFSSVKKFPVIWLLPFSCSNTLA